jgi:transcription elongation factor Elf1
MSFDKPKYVNRIASLEAGNYKCPDCDYVVETVKTIPQRELGEIVSCGGCGLELEVKKVGQKFDLYELHIEGEDWGE